MKNLKKSISELADRVNRKWSALTVKKQRKYLQLFSILYVLINVTVIVDTCFNCGRGSIEIEHIENPTLRKARPHRYQVDSISHFFKKQKL